MKPVSTPSVFRSFLFRTLSRLPVVLSVWVLAASGLFFYSRAAFHFIREESSSPRTDFSLRLFFYLGLLFLSFLSAVLADTLFNQKAWLRHFGREVLPEGESETDRPQFSRHPIQFYFYGLFFFVAGWFIYDISNNHFHSYYYSIGKYMTQLRSPDENERLVAIEHLAASRHPRMVELLAARITSGTPREKLLATWAAGNAEINDGRIADAIWRNTSDADDALRRTSYLALARMVERPTVAFVQRLEEELRRFLADNRPPPPHLLFAAAFLRTPEFLPVFLDLFVLEDDTTSVIATYAIVWMAGPTADQNRSILAQLDRNIAKNERIRCMNAVALLFMAPELSQETLMALRREFEAKSSDFRCRPEVFSLHPFDARRDTINLTRINIQGFVYTAASDEFYRERLLRVLARVREDTLIPWLERMSKNEQLSEHLRDLCRQAATARPARAPSLNW